MPIIKYERQWSEGGEEGKYDEQILCNQLHLMRQLRSGLFSYLVENRLRHLLSLIQYVIYRGDPNRRAMKWTSPLPYGKWRLMELLVVCFDANWLTTKIWRSQLLDRRYLINIRPTSFRTKVFLWITTSATPWFACKISREREIERERKR